MSLTQGEILSAADFNNLRDAINTLMNKRNYRDNLAQYKGTSSVSASDLTSRAKINNILAPYQRLKAQIPTSTPSDAIVADTLIVASTFATINSDVATMATYNNLTQSGGQYISGCGGACAGLCVDWCNTGCSGGCSWGCGNGCRGGCAGGCSGCQGCDGCGNCSGCGNCGYCSNCSTSCQGKGSNECSSCEGGCGPCSGCINACSGCEGCDSSCENACSGSCGSVCQGTCTSNTVRTA